MLLKLGHNLESIDFPNSVEIKSGCRTFSGENRVKKAVQGRNWVIVIIEVSQRMLSDS